jgi:hypothetical protein
MKTRALGPLSDVSPHDRFVGLKEEDSCLHLAGMPGFEPYTRTLPFNSMR